MSEVDQKKYDKQRPKIDAVLKKQDAKKEQAAEKFKVGQYGEAIKIYKSAAESLEIAIEDFPLFKQELIQYEATIFNNLAACCNKDMNSKLEIEYTTKVIDIAHHLTDTKLVLKAFLRRGLAYE